MNIYGPHQEASGSVLRREASSLILVLLMCFVGAITISSLARAERMPSRASPQTLTPAVISPEMTTAVGSPQMIMLPPITTREAFSKALGSTGHTVAAVGRSPAGLGLDARIEIGEDTESIAFRIVSPGAKHLRSGVVLPAAGTYRVIAFSPGHESRATLVSRATDAASSEPIWSGLTDGDTQTIVVKREKGIGSWTASVALVSHFWDAVAGARSVIGPESFGDSASCQVDLACVIAQVTPVQQDEIHLASRAVALMITTDAIGNSYTCTGTLLNSANYPAPFLITANHCINHAQTLLTIWQYERTNCGFGNPPSYAQVTGGGTVLYRSAALDAGFVLLNQLPPSGVSYSGWDDNAITSTTLMLALHHPRGDVKKASLGSVVGVNTIPVTINMDDGPYTFGPDTFYLVNWLAGIVEPGSSGSGVFTFGDFNQYFYLRGTLTGGRTSCGDVGNTYYSKLANVYPYISGPLTVPVPPPSATNYQGLWWKSPANSESGWGINFAHQGDTIFATWFTYDANGLSVWYVMTANKTAPSTYSGTLYTTTGPPFNATPFNPALIKATSVGVGTLNFSDVNNGTFSYTIGATSQTKTITREIFGSQVPTCAYGAQPNLSLATNYQDLWWVAGGAESGWGINLTHQGNTIFATWFTYDFTGYAMWLVVTAQMTSPGNYSGTLYLTFGPPFNSVPFDPAKVVAQSVGTASFAFTNGNNATFSYNINGASIDGAGPQVTQTKQLVREVFQAPGTVCK